jgi:hypothetical protein
MKRLYLLMLLSILALASLTGCTLSVDGKPQERASVADPTPDPTPRSTQTPSPMPSPTSTPAPTVLIEGVTYPEDLPYLDLSYAALNDPSEIAQLKYLEELVMDNSGITDASFLSGMQSLRTLSLSGNSIEDPSPLYSLTSLEQLDLDGNPISYDGLLEVKEALPECEVIGSFSISVADLENYPGISAQVKGSSIDLTSLTISNDTPFGVTVAVPLGTYFGASGSVQNMVVLNSKEMFVSPGSSATKKIDTACMNIERSIPDSTDVMSVNSLDTASRLARLVEVLDENDCYYDVSQAAVWLVTDNPGDYALLHTLYDGYSDVISDDELALAKQMVALADSR